MALATVRLPRVRPDIWHRKFGPALALGLVFLPFAAILAWAFSAPPLDSRDLAASISIERPAQVRASPFHDSPHAFVCCQRVS